MSSIINQLFERGGSSPSSSDSDQNKTVKSSFAFVDSRPSIKEHRAQDAQLKEINEKLANGEKIDFSQYSNIVVVYFRGDNTLRTTTSQPERQEIRRRITAGEFKEGIYSAAAYELAGLKFGTPVDTREKKIAMKEAIRKLNAEFETLATTHPYSKNWWGKKFEAETLEFQHLQRFVNTYGEFVQESRARDHECYQILSATSCPYISTSTDPRIAVSFAMGNSAAADGCLRPGYNPDTLKAKHRKIGYVQSFFFTLANIAHNSPLPIQTLHASRKIEVNPRMEAKEMTFKTAIKAEDVITSIVQFPSLNCKYKPGFQAKYGFNARRYADARAALNNKSPGSRFVTWLIDHYAKQLENQAWKIAREKGAFLVKLGLDGRLTRVEPTKLDIATAKGKHEDLYETFKQCLGAFKGDTEIDELADEFTDLTVEEVADPLTYDEINEILHCDLEEIQERVNDGRLSIDAIDDKFGCSLLMWAILNQKYGLINLLLEKGAALHNVSFQGITILHCAAKQKDPVLLQQILDLVPEYLNYADSNEETPLIYAIDDRNVEGVKLLISQPDIANLAKSYAYATENGRPKIAQILQIALQDAAGYETETETKKARRTVKK